MSYTKNTWATSDTITAAKLNNMENGIEAANDPYAGYDIVILGAKGENDAYIEEDWAVSDLTVIAGSYQACEAKMLAGEPVRGVLVLKFYSGNNYVSVYLPLKCVDADYTSLCFAGPSGTYGFTDSCWLYYNSSYELTDIGWGT